MIFNRSSQQKNPETIEVASYDKSWWLRSILLTSRICPNRGRYHINQEKRRKERNKLGKKKRERQTKQTDKRKNERTERKRNKYKRRSRDKNVYIYKYIYYYLLFIIINYYYHYLKKKNY